MDLELLEPERNEIDFRSLELRELNEPRHERLIRSSDLSEFELTSSNGIPFRVYVSKNKGTPIVTFHDIGTNYTSFIPFFNIPEMKVILRQFSVYHICAPGHHDTSGPLSKDSLVKNEEELLLGDADAVYQTDHVYTIHGKTNQTSNVEYPSLDALASLVDTVVNHFQLRSFVGFGVGAGSNILTRAALLNSTRMLGLFLVNPTCSSSSYYKWFRNKWSTLPYLQKGIIPESIKTQMEVHWFGDTKDPVNNIIAELYHNYMCSLNLINVAGYIQSYIDRTDLGLVRDQSASNSNTAITVETFLVTGELAKDLCKNLAEMNGRMDPAKTQYIQIPEATGMVMEENPEKLAYTFLNFLRTISLVINLTPEKMKLEASRLLSSNYSLNESADQPTPFSN